MNILIISTTFSLSTSASWEKFVEIGKIDQLNYTQKSCEKSCQAIYTYEKCHCVDSSIMTYVMAEMYWDYIPEACDRLDGDLRACLEEVEISWKFCFWHDLPI